MVDEMIKYHELFQWCTGKWASCEVRVEEPWFVAFADFQGIKTSVMANFKISRA